MSCLNIPTTAQAVDLRYPEESFAGFCLIHFPPTRSAGDTKNLFPRSAAEAAEAEGILKLCLGPNAPQSLVEMFTSHQPLK
jgi:hypothetical protein